MDGRKKEKIIKEWKVWGRNKFSLICVINQKSSLLNKVFISFVQQPIDLFNANHFQKKSKCHNFRFFVPTNIKEQDRLLKYFPLPFAYYYIIDFKICKTLLAKLTNAKINKFMIIPPCTTTQEGYICFYVEFP